MSRKRKKKKGRSPIVGRPGDAKRSDRPSDGAEATARRRKPLLPVLAVALVVAGGVVHGVQTHRWAPAADVSEAAGRLNDVPHAIGAWTATDLDVPASQLEQAGAVGCLYRTYRNGDTGESVQVMLLCGPHGPISVHPPTVCFTGAGWAVKGTDGAVVKDRAGKRTLGRFRVANFEKPQPEGPIRMQTYWAWCSTGDWQTPERPRFAFAGSPYLFKIYVSRVLPPSRSQRTAAPAGSKDEKRDDLCVRFLRDFLPALAQAHVGSL